MKLYIEWSHLTDSQKQQVVSFYKEELETGKVILNQRSYRINPKTGDFVPQKDF